MQKNIKTVLITGTNRGIGRAILENFAKLGFNIIAHARERTKDHQATINCIGKKYKIKLNAIYFDLADTIKIKAELKALIKNKIPIDVLVNNAGVIHGGLFQMSKISEIRHIFEINFFSIMEITQIVCKYMVRRKSGCIINISSVAGIDLGAGNCAYGTSKSALIAFSKTLASEMSNYGVRVNVVAPSLTDTDMGNSPQASMEREMLKSNIPFRRMALAEEIANVVIFLATEKSSFINGEVIRVDGGNKF